ncbi:1015_t:CDS:10 [Funneliformis geosporum]|nr:1015_t:CDS:10 [Funneliformis geosporum]
MSFYKVICLLYCITILTPLVSPTPFWNQELIESRASGNHNPKTNTFDLVLKKVNLAPDGFTRVVSTINGQYPGPTIEANKGDRIVMNIHNELEAPTAIHSHGMFQRGTPWYDGVPGQTQCEIPNNYTFTYNFTVPDQAGTYWYHSHALTQYVDGIVGALIPDNGLINGKNNYDCSKAPPGSTCVDNADIPWTDFLEECIDLDPKTLQPLYEENIPEATREIKLNIAFHKDSLGIDKAFLNESTYVPDFTSSTLTKIFEGKAANLSTAENAFTFNTFGEVVDIYFINTDDGEHPFHMRCRVFRYFTEYETFRYYSLAVWDVDFDNKRFKLVSINKGEVLFHESKELLELSNDKLLIYSCKNNPYIRDLGTSKNIQITSQPLDDYQCLRFLPNGDLLMLRDLYINVYSKASLKNSKFSPRSYKIPPISHDLGIKMINVNRIVQKNGQIFITLDNVVILQSNTKKMKNENYYEIPNITKRQNFDSKYCSWMGGAVNKEESLFAISLAYKEDVYTNVFSMKNGILISSRHDTINDVIDLRIQFINTNNTDILMLHRRIEDKIEYTIMSPYDLKYSYKDEYHHIHNMIVETFTSQCLLMIATGTQINLIGFNIPVKELYNQLKHDRNLFIYSSFNDIKDGIRNLGQINKSSHYQGKNLRWEFQSETNKLEVQLQNKKKFSLDFNSHIGFEHLQILSNDHVVLYGCGIFIFGFNETTNTIVFRYFYKNFDKFLVSESPPNPTLPCVYTTSLWDEINIINELLCSRKYLVEMSDEIIDYAIEQNKSRLLDSCLNKLNEVLTEDNTTNYRICGLITKHLPRLYLYFPTYYTKFISDTTFIPNPYIIEYYVSDKIKLFGYTTNVHAFQVYNCRESDVIQLISQISRVFQKKVRTKNKAINFVHDYHYLKELLIPNHNIFVTLIDQTFYDSWNAEALLNFKWNTFGRFYYFLIWGFFTMFLLSFGIGSIQPYNLSGIRKDISKIYGIDLAANIFPVYTAFVWLYNDHTPNLWLISISNLFLHFKFITYLRALDYFGSNFTIIIGVAKRILSFLLILFFIIVGFAHAFYIILSTEQSLSHGDIMDMDMGPYDFNNIPTYNEVKKNGDIGDIAFIEVPAESPFESYPSTLLAMYMFLTVDPSSLGSSWKYKQTPFIAALLIMFSFLIVVYLMNLFIGLLNLEIEENRTHSLFMLEKAKILAEIELFLLLPNQRRWQHWFPDVIFYDISIENVQRRINDMDKNPASYSSQYISEKLRSLAELKVKDPMTKTECENLVNRFMTKTDCEDLVKRFKDEIRILIHPDNNVEDEKTEE